MTVNISKPALNLREELAALRNQGGAYEESKFYLGDLVTNGTFDSDVSGWAVQIGHTGGAGVFDGGSLKLSGTTNPYNWEQQITTVLGKTYAVTATMSRTSGIPVVAAVATGIGTIQSVSSTQDAIKTYSFTFVATGNDLISLRAGSTSGDQLFDNISVYETDGTDAIHSTPHGYSIKDVYIDGELAREGSAYDYTVHDGYIKPTIAPTATTETCLIGVRT